MDRSVLLSEDQLRIEQSKFISRVYAWMTGALALTGITAYIVVNSPFLLEMIFSTKFVFLFLIIAELGVVWYLSSAIKTMSLGTARLVFLLYSLMNGLTLSVIFLVYTADSISNTFFITAGTFGAMSFYGYTTKKDLTSIGSIAFMGLIGVIIASIVNMFLHSDMLQWIVTMVGVLVFVGLTAYDTQKIKNMSEFVEGDTETESKGALMGALALYLDFINLFIMLLRIFGRRR